MYIISGKAKTLSVVKSVCHMLFEVMLRRLLSGIELSCKSLALKHNGSVVWLGAVCVRVGEFFASPGKRTLVVWSREKLITYESR
jgi:hypothetical protein